MLRIGMILLSCILLANCSSKPTFDLMAGKMVRETYCNGKYSEWQICFENAQVSCPEKGYRILNQDSSYSDPAPGSFGLVPTLGKAMIDDAFNGKDGHRRLVFACNL